MTRRAGVAAVVCLALAALGGPALAQPGPSPQFTKAYNDAVTEYNNGVLSGDYGKAKAGFDKAIQFDDRWPGPYRYLALIGKAEKKFEDCLANAFTAVKKNPEGKQAPATRELHEECRQALNRPKFREQFGDGGAISVSTGTDHSGAKVKLNGLTMGATPFIRGFSVGQVLVEVELEGFLPGKAEAEILAGVVTDVIFELKVDPNADNKKPPPETTDIDEGWVVITPRPAGATVIWDGKPAELDREGRIVAKPGTYEVEVSADGHEPWRRRVRVAKGQSSNFDVVLRSTTERQSLRKKGYLFLGVAGAFAIAGTVTGLLEMAKFEEAQDIWEVEVSRPSDGRDSSSVEPLMFRDDIDDLRKEGKRLQVISGVAFGLAAASLGASIYYFVKERPAEREGFELPLAVAPTAGDGGLGAQVTYTTRLDW